MKTTEVKPGDLVASVLALPPLARTSQGALDRVENEKVVRWLASGAITTCVYGGVANVLNIGVRDYPALLDHLEEIAGAETWMVPSIGPDFGKAMDQIDILRDRAFPTAMLFPLFGPLSAPGVATGIRRLSDRLGKPLMVFLLSETFLSPNDSARLIADGVICCLEYGLGKQNPGDDPYLDALVQAVGTDRIVDGVGEKTVIERRRYAMTGFTSGSALLAPHLATQVLRAMVEGDIERAIEMRAPILPFEALRSLHGPIPVLHDAVELAGVAKTGPIGPFFASIADPKARAEIASAACALLHENQMFSQSNPAH